MADQQGGVTGITTLEHERWKHDLRREDAQATHGQVREFRKQLNEIAVKSGDAALKAVMLINGGAAVSVLAFVGGMVAQDRVKVGQLTDVTKSLMFFVYGVSAAVLAMGLTYFVHYVTLAHGSSRELIWEHPYTKDGKRTRLLGVCKAMMHLLTVIVGFSALGLFIWGMTDVKDAIVKLGMTVPAK